MTAAPTAAKARLAVRRDWSAEPAMVEIINIHKSFGDTKVLEGIDLTIHAGEVVSIVGPSGSGKSTLLRLINHLDAPDRGLIRIADQLVAHEIHEGRLRERRERDIAKQRSQIGMVFQQFNLFRHLTALGNVALGPIRVTGIDAAVARDQARDLLVRVGLGHRLNAYPGSLSGGEQQRVGIARALAMQPKVMLFDEPTSALDPERVDEVLDVIRDLAATGMTMIIVTHELEFARDVADTLVFIDNGVVIETGPCGAVLKDPRHDRTREFISRVL
jgi:polar amino acid transport system ATP-binding protein